MTPKRRSLLALSTALLAAATLSACSAGSAGSSPSSTTMEQQLSPEAISEGGAFDSQVLDGKVANAGQRSIIRTGEASITVADPLTAADEVAKIAQDQGGSVENRSTNRASAGGSPSASLNIRVPQDRLDQTFEALSKIGTMVYENRSDTDVTLQHTDLQARVEALQTSVDRLNELLASSASTSDLIEIESALSQRQQDLDGLRAQLNSLENQVNEATIWVSLSTDAVIPGGPSNFWEGLLLGLNSLQTAAAGALVVAGVLLPWLVLLGVLGGVVVFIVVAVHRRRRRSAANNSEL